MRRYENIQYPLYMTLRLHFITALAFMRCKDNNIYCNSCLLSKQTYSTNLRKSAISKKLVISGIALLLKDE